MHWAIFQKKPHWSWKNAVFWPFVAWSINDSSLSILECYERIRTGYKHFTYRNSLQVTTLEECVAECKKAGNCKTFSFKYRQVRRFKNTILSNNFKFRRFTEATRSTKIMNCLLADLATVQLKESDFDRTSSSSDGDWDIFELSSDPNCNNNNNNNGGSGYIIGEPEGKY